MGRGLVGGIPTSVGPIFRINTVFLRPIFSSPSVGSGGFAQNFKNNSIAKVLSICLLACQLRSLNCAALQKGNLFQCDLPKNACGTGPSMLKSSC